MKFAIMTIMIPLFLTSCLTDRDKTGLKFNNLNPSLDSQSDIKGEQDSQSDSDIPVEKEMSEEEIQIKKDKIEEKRAMNNIEPITTDLSQSCHLLTNIELKSKKELINDKYSDEILFSDYHNSEFKTYKTNDLVQNYFQTLPMQAKSHVSSFKGRLVYESVNDIISEQKKYIGILEIDSLEKKYDDLLSCASNHSNSKINKFADEFELPENIDSEEVYKVFIVNNLINAFKAKVLLNIKKGIEKDNKEELKEHSKNATRNRRGRIGTLGQIQRKAINKNNQDRLESAKTYLQDMHKDAPLLLEPKNDYSLQDWVQMDIGASDILKRILRDFKPELIDQMTKAFIETPNIAAFEPVILAPENQEYLDQYALNLIADKKLRKMIRKSLSSYLDDTISGANQICESNAKNLHFNKALVKDILGHNLEKDQYTLHMASDHGTLCYLLKEEPLEEAGGIGITSILGGLTIGVGLLTIGFGGSGSLLILAGSTMIISDTAISIHLSNKEEAIRASLHLGGWSEYREVTEQVGVTYDLMADLATDGAISAISGGVGVVLKQTTKGIAKIDEMQALDDISEEAIKAKRIKRGHINKALIEDGSQRSIRDYKNLIMRRHTDLWEAYKKSDKRHRIKVRREFWRKYNRNDIPAHYMFGQSGDETLSILEILRDQSRMYKLDGSLTEDGEKALKKARDWIQNYKSYANELDSTVDLGFQAKKQAPELQSALKKYRTKDFFDGKTQEIDLTYVVNGKYEVKQKTFYSRYEIVEALREQERLEVTTFARNSLEELTTKSDLYQIMDQQAVDFRKMEFLKRALSKVLNKTENQKELLRETRDLIEKRTDLKPRPDAIARLERKELRSERKDFFRSVRKKRKLINGLGLKLSDVATETAMKTGFVGRHFKTALFLGLSTTSGSFLTSYLSSGGTIDEIRSNSSKTWDELSRKINSLVGRDFSSAEIECAKSPRSFSFQLCMNEVIRTQIAIERARAIETNKDYRFENDSAVTQKILNLSYKMIELRKKMRSAEIFNTTMELLSNAYDESMIHKVVEKVNAIASSREVGLRVGAILSAVTEEDAQRLLKESEKILGVDFTVSVQFILNNRSKVVSVMKESGQLPQQLEHMIKGIDLEQSEINISENSIIDFTLEQIEDIQIDFKEN